MDNVSILFFTDPHNSDTPPRMRKEGYRDEILAKQEFLIKHARKADLVIIGGDIFHQKKPHKISHYLVNRLMEIYREYGDVIIVPGNHDFDMRPEEIKYNALGILNRLPNVGVMGNMWLDYRNLSMCLSGFGQENTKEAIQKWHEHKLGEEYYGLVVAHDNISTQKYPFETVPFSQIEHDADLFMFGHLHTWQELGGKVVAPGALSRGVLEKDTIDRRVGYAWVSIDLDEKRHSIKGYDVPIKPAEEVFRVEEYSFKKSVDLAIQEVAIALGDLAESGVTHLDLDKAIDFIEKMDVDEPIKEKAIDILRSI